MSTVELIRTESTVSQVSVVLTLEAGEAMILLIAVAILLLVVAGAVLLICAQQRMAFPESATTTDLPDDLFVDRYSRMLRLLDTRHLEFLQRQPGFTPRMAARFRKEETQDTTVTQLDLLSGRSSTSRAAGV